MNKENHTDITDKERIEILEARVNELEKNQLPLDAVSRTFVPTVTVQSPTDKPEQVTATHREQLARYWDRKYLEGL